MRWLDWLLPDLSGVILDLLPKCDPKYEDDLLLALKKAHLGKLPKGQYTGQLISVQTFSRDELRIPLEAETLHQMDECVTVRKHDVQLSTVSSKTNMWRSQLTVWLALSLQFEGEKADGEKVNVSIGRTLLMAYIERDKVRGMALRTLRAAKE